MSEAFVIGISGGSGSGKSTFAERLMNRYPGEITLISCDNYYRRRDEIPPEERAQLNYDAPEALEFDLMVEHLRALKRGEAVECPVYDFTTHNRSDQTLRLQPRPVLLVDGILILWERRLRELMDLKIYVEADADERILRRIRRDVMERGRTIDNVSRQYLETVKPMHNLYVEPSKRDADIVINGGLNQAAFELVCAQIERVGETSGTGNLPESTRDLGMQSR